MNNTDPRQSSIAFIESLGWKQFPSDKDYAIDLYKKFDVQPSCYCNKKGIQLCVSLCYLPEFKEDIEGSWDIKLRAQSSSGDWIDFSFYSLSLDELESKLMPLSDKLIKAWKQINL